MGKITGNEPAHPFEYDGFEDREPVRRAVSGLTIRQYFAAMAMQGICAKYAKVGEDGIIAELSVIQADALIKELNK